MNVLETFLVVYSIFVTCLLLMAFIALRIIHRTVRFWFGQYQFFHDAYNEMCRTAAGYREAYEKDIANKPIPKIRPQEAYGEGRV